MAHTLPDAFAVRFGATHSADGDNPLCGDTLHVDCALAGDTVTEVRFEGSSGAIATASASLMTESLKGQTRDEARAPVRIECATLSWQTMRSALRL